MKKNYIFYFYKVTKCIMALSAAFTGINSTKNSGCDFFLRKIWPKIFMSIWFPIPVMVLLKILQYLNNKEWESLLEITHMFFAGCYALYVLCVLQIISHRFTNTMDIIEKKFRAVDEIVSSDLLNLLTLWVLLSLCWLFYFGGCIWYKENLVPLWVPFTDNDKEPTFNVFVGVWAYESLVALYMFFVFMVLCPFIIVSRVCVCKEISYLMRAIRCYSFEDQHSNSWFCNGAISGFGNHSKKEESVSQPSDKKENVDSKRFFRKLVSHHVIIHSVIDHVSRINSCIYFVQTIFTVVHSCVLVFNLYYTTNTQKVMLKSSPILALSYYLMFTYCWNGQQLTDKCEELRLALYLFPWYECPHSFQTSFLIMTEVLRRPVYLMGGGIFKATLQTFLTCLQQSVSYILVLKALTPEKESS